MTRNRPDHVRYTQGGRGNGNVSRGGVEMEHNDGENVRSNSTRMGVSRRLEGENGGTHGGRPVVVQQLGNHVGRPPHQLLRGGSDARDLRNLREGQKPRHTGWERAQLGSEPRERANGERSSARGDEGRRGQRGRKLPVASS